MAGSSPAKARGYSPFHRSGGAAGRVRLRRVSPVAAPSSDRLLSEPRAGTQHLRQEPLFMPLSGHCQTTTSTSQEGGNASFPSEWPLRHLRRERKFRVAEGGLPHCPVGKASNRWSSIAPDAANSAPSLSMNSGTTGSNPRRDGRAEGTVRRVGMRLSPRPSHLEYCLRAMHQAQRRIASLAIY